MKALSELPVLKEWVEKEWLHQIDNKYQPLSRVPSSYLRGYLRLFLSDTNKYNLDFLMKMSLGQNSYEESHGNYLKANHMQVESFYDRSVSDIKPELKEYLKSPEAEKEKAEQILGSFDGVETPKSKDIRKGLMMWLHYSGQKMYEVPVG